MARMRTIKPGFFTNDELAEIEPIGRLLFAGLWCIADREGRLEDRPKRIKIEVLPYDACDVDALLGELAARGFVRRYEGADGARYIQVVNFGRHQSPHIHEAASTIPAPCEHGACTVPAPSLTVVGSENLVVGSGDTGVSGGDAPPPPPAAAAGFAAGADAPPPAADADGDDAAIPPVSAPKLKTVFGEESDAMQLAREFARGLREVKSDVKLPRDGLQSWAREFDLLLRVDHRPREKIEAVMRYARRSSFWRTVILSARSLREKFDRLDLQREEDANNGTVRGSGRRAETQAGSSGSGGRGLGSARGGGFPSGAACGAGPRSGSPRRDGRGAGRTGAGSPGTINGFEVGTPEYYADAKRRREERAAASGY